MSKRATQRVDRKSAGERQKPLALVDDKQKRPRRRLPWLVILSLACVFTVIFGVLLARVVLVKTSFKLQKLQEDVTAAEELHEELMLKAAEMESPARIEGVARAQGMVDPATVNYIVANLPKRAEKRFAYGVLPERVATDTNVAAVAEGSP